MPQLVAAVEQVVDGREDLDLRTGGRHGVQQVAESLTRQHARLHDDLLGVAAFKHRGGVIDRAQDFQAGDAGMPQPRVVVEESEHVVTAARGTDEASCDQFTGMIGAHDDGSANGRA